MKFQDNIKAVVALNPNYLGFIFYEKSKRHFEGVMPKLPKTIIKVGVFVAENIEKVVETVRKYKLKAIQLHGGESVVYCQLLQQKLEDSDNKNIEIIKVFSVDNDFDFNTIKPFEAVANYFLFDTKGKDSGGNGVTFDWKLLEKYPSQKLYFLSGGIGLESIASLKSFMQNPLSKYCFAIDVNSRFEVAPGNKNIEKLKIFKNNLV